MFEEESSKKTLILGYIITNIACILSVIGLMFLYKLFEQTELQQIYLVLANSFVIPGSLLLLFTALIACANQGSLDAIGYMLKRLGQSLLPLSKKTHEKYGDYVENKKRVKGYGFLGWSGLIYFVIGMIFTALFFTV